MRTQPITEAGVDAALVALLRAAYALPSDDDARSYVGVTPVQRADGSLARGHLYGELKICLHSFSWELPLLIVALGDIIRDEAGDSTGLQVVVGLLVRSARECHARRRATFSSIVNRACSLSWQSGVPVEAPPYTRIKALDADTRAAAAAGRTYARCLTFIDMLKERALASAFVEPCLGRWRHCICVSSFYFRMR